MEIDIRDLKSKDELKVKFADQKKHKTDEYDFANGTCVTLSCYGAKPHLKINNGNILIKDWENFKKAVDYILKAKSENAQVADSINNQN